MKFVRTISLVAITEMQIARRSLRFRVIAPALTLGLFTCYVLSCVIHLQYAPYIPSFASSIPLYLLGCVDPFLFVLVQLAALMLIFDVDQRNSRCRISEVLGCKPISNIEFLGGRVVGCAMLIWVVVAVNLFSFQLFGLFVQLVDSDFGWSFQVHSLFNLLFLDLTATLLIWGALALFLGKLVRFRLLILPLTVLAMLGWYLLTTVSSYEHLELFSASSNDSLFVSDLLPQIASLPSVAVRFGTVAFAAVLIGISAWMQKRYDELQNKHRMIALAGLFLLGTASITFSHAMIEHRINQVDDWRQTHEALLWEGELDVRKISGNVRIDPVSRLDLDLTLEFEAVGVKPSTELIFAFNPGFEISELQINSSPVQFLFEKGVLRVQHDVRIQDGTVHSMHVVASGVPNPRFSYLDSNFDYLAEPGMPLQAVRSFGTNGSIFGKDYVALMPGAYWYPQPGSAFKHVGKSRSRTDYFNVDLLVELVKPKWRLVGPDAKQETDVSGNWFAVHPDAPISDLALFASEFETVTTTIGDLQLKYHLHAKHANLFKVFEPLEELVSEWASVMLQRASDHNLAYPFHSLSIVEVPNRLRTIGGGWRVNTLSTLPGMVLQKEQGLPAVRIDRAIQREKELPEKFSRLYAYFQETVGSDNVVNTLPQHLWSHVTRASGPYSDALDQVIHALVAELLVTVPISSFSPYSSPQVLTMTRLQTPLVVLFSNYRRRYLNLLHQMEHERIARPAVWDRMEDIDVAQLPSKYGHQADLELVLLKSRKIAEALIEYHWYDRDKIGSWLSSVRTRFAGRTYQYEDLLAVAREHGVTVDPFLTEWLTTSKVPGFVASESSVIRISNNALDRRRYQISFVVRNTQSITGLISPVTNMFFPKPVLIEPQSAKRINLIWDATIQLTEFDSIPVRTSLSLNRIDLQISIDQRRIPERLTLQPGPLAESSDWNFDQQGIIVDDLDPGFTVLQPKLKSSRFMNIGPASWFQWPNQEYDYDGVLPIEDWHTSLPLGWWGRRINASAYGLHRRTVAETFVYRNRTPRTARFFAEIPASASWTLDYHFDGDFFVLFENTKLELRIRNGENSWDVEFNPSDGIDGWKRVGEFDLIEGNVSVDVVESSKNGYIYADAIRWTQSSAE